MSADGVCRDCGESVGIFRTDFARDRMLCERCGIAVLAGERVGIRPGEVAFFHAERIVCSVVTYESFTPGAGLPSVRATCHHPGGFRVGEGDSYRAALRSLIRLLRKGAPE